MSPEDKLESGNMYMTTRELACIRSFPTKATPDFIYTEPLPRNAYFVFLEEVTLQGFGSIHGTIPKSTYSKILVGKNIVYTYKVKKLLGFLDACAMHFT